MRFLIPSFLCLLLVVMGCHSSKLSSESGETPAPNHLSDAAAEENGSDASHIARGTPVAESRPTQTDDNRTAADAAAASPVQPSRSLFDWGHRNPTDYGWNEDALQRMSVFESLLSTDPAAARAAMTEVAEIRFGKHPLVDEWSELGFRLFRDRKANVLETKRYLELEVQLLTSVDAETHAKAIREYQVGLAQFTMLIQLIKSQGDDPASIEAEFTPFNPNKEED